MSDTPDWVRKLQPAGPQGGELLAAERAKSDLNVKKISEFMFTAEVLKRKDRILEILMSEKVFDKSQNYFSGRKERIIASIAKGKKLANLAKQHKWSFEDFHMANDLLSESTPYRLHDSMFMVTLEGQGTPEQHKLFLEPARNHTLIGCYAQTELGHGSNVRGLETQAVWDPSDKTFVIHSPSLTASKWWIGALGMMSTHAVVMAQLIINGKSYGPHPFVVPIRDPKTHRALPNVHVGDIGPKFGFNTTDNGFLLFNKVKIPHVNMLARYSKVDPETGKYQRPPAAALVYGTMTFIRATIVQEAGRTLARGVTIATRYCSVRRQFQDRDSADQKGETQVINYKMVQIRLLPLLAATFALHFTGKAMAEMYWANQKKMKEAVANAQGGRGPGPEEIQAGSDMLADLHATSCGLKSLGSTIAAEGLEVCRRACGGHGYSNFSGIGPFYADYLPTCTWEGDNFMLTQQVARYLLKSARTVLKGGPITNDTTRILKTFHERQDMGAAFDILSSDTDIVAAFAWRAAYLTFEALKRRDELKMAWNDLLVDFYRLSKAHSQYLIVKNFYEAIQAYETRTQLGPGGLEVMEKLYRLWALHTLETEASEFYTSSACTVRQIQLARANAVMTLLEDIRPHAVRLVDAWDFPDWQLDSSLGRYDGNVYEDMFYRASEQNPINKLVINPYPAQAELVKEDRTHELSPKL